MMVSNTITTAKLYKNFTILGYYQTFLGIAEIEVRNNFHFLIFIFFSVAAVQQLQNEKTRLFIYAKYLAHVKTQWKILQVTKTRFKLSSVF